MVLRQIVDTGDPAAGAGAAGVFARLADHRDGAVFIEHSRWERQPVGLVGSDRRAAPA